MHARIVPNFQLAVTGERNLNTLSATLVIGGTFRLGDKSRTHASQEIQEFDGSGKFGSSRYYKRYNS